jgi:hypothetical protein
MEDYDLQQVELSSRSSVSASLRVCRAELEGHGQRQVDVHVASAQNFAAHCSHGILNFCLIEKLHVF